MSNPINAAADAFIPCKYDPILVVGCRNLQAVMTENPKSRSHSPNKRTRDSTGLSVKRHKKQGTSSSNQSDSDSLDARRDVEPPSWSLEFRQLEQVFRSLNTVYTFCCTRKHFPTTFDNLKSSVENLTGRFSHTQSVPMTFLGL